MLFNRNKPLVAINLVSSDTRGWVFIGLSTFIIMTTLLSITTIRRLNVMNESVSTLDSDYLPGAIWAGKVGVDLAEVRRLQSRYMVVEKDNVEESGEALFMLNQSITRTDDAIKHLESRLDHDEENTTYLADFDLGWPLYKSYITEMVALKNSGNLEAATEIWRTSSRNELGNLLKFVAWDIEYNQRTGKRAGGFCHSEYAAVWWSFVAITVLPVFFSIVIMLGLLRPARPHDSRISERTDDSHKDSQRRERDSRDLPPLFLRPSDLNATSVAMQNVMTVLVACEA